MINGLKGINFEKGYLTENEINLMRRRLNQDGGGSNYAKLNVSEISFPEGGFAISDEQTDKGIEWLINQWKGKTGRELPSNPFGYREQEIIEYFDCMGMRLGEFRLIQFKNVKDSNYPFYIPVYRVKVKSHGFFDYYYYAGKIHITM
jgi:hypothetical protein